MRFSPMLPISLALPLAAWATLASAVDTNSSATDDTVLTEPATCSRNYTVQAWDICDSISQNQRVSSYQLASGNTLLINEECTNLQVGMNLCLAWAGADCTELRTVLGSDTCHSIAKGAGIDYELLRTNNPQIDEKCWNIYPGQVLCVASTVQVNPYSSGKPVPVNWRASSKASASFSYQSASASATPPAATFYAAQDALAVGIDYDSLSYCDEL